MSANEDEYRRRMNALSGRERVARAIAQFNWAREMIARQIIAENANLMDE